MKDQIMAVKFVLIICVFAMALCFTGDVAQKAEAQSGTTECDTMDAVCRANLGFAYAICSSKGWDSDACAVALAKAAVACWPWVVNCGGG